MGDDAPHLPVLYDQVLAALDVSAGGLYIDGTVGAGGHAAGVLQASAPNGRLLGLDRDPDALEISRRRLAPFGERVILVHDSFAHMTAVADALGLGPADGVLLDLGVSSMQLSDPERGFAFQFEGPLDMRMDPTLPRTAADLVNELQERELADLLYRYGEEPAARRIARAIVAARPLSKTAELAEIVARVARQSKIHPATRTFQALRIAVNDELGQLQQGLVAAVTCLKPGGRLAVITFHSLEDRIVKQFMFQEARDCICPPEAMVCTCGHRATLQVLTRKPIRPDEREMAQNPRSRSAKLRVASRR